MDAAFAHMVLHYVPSPREVVKEMARIIKPVGRIVIVVFVEHENEWMTLELDIRWKGFEIEDVRSWFDYAQLSDFQYERSVALGSDRKLPAAFIATGVVPGD